MFLSLCIYWSNSRSGIFLLILVFAVYVFFILLSLKKAKYVIAMVILLLMAYLGYLSVGSYVSNEDQSSAFNTSNVVNSIKSVFNPEARSNPSRYGYMIATAQVGKDHFLLGTGTSYVGPYISEKLLERNKNNGELELWISMQQEKGILNSVFPNINEYTSSFASGGILGLLLSLSLLIYLCFYYLYYVIKQGFKVLDGFSIMIISMLFVVLAWGMSNTFMINFLYPISLALGLCDINRLRNSINSDSCKTNNEIK